MWHTSLVQVFTFASQLSRIERVLFMKGFTFSYGELWLVSQKHMALMTRVSWSLYCAW